MNKTPIAKTARSGANSYDAYDPYMSLAASIIRQAILDYINARSVISDFEKRPCPPDEQKLYNRLIKVDMWRDKGQSPRAKDYLSRRWSAVCMTPEQWLTRRAGRRKVTGAELVKERKKMLKNRYLWSTIPETKSRNAKYHKACKDMNDVKKFFNSEWFEELSGIQGTPVLSMLNRMSITELKKTYRGKDAHI